MQLYVRMRPSRDSSLAGVIAPPEGEIEMPVRQSRRPLTLALAVAASTPAFFAPAVGSAATYTFSNPNGGTLNVSTNYTPSGIPGAADTLRIDALPTVTGFLTLTLASNQSIGRIENNHFAPTTINANLNGSGQPFTLTLSQGQIAFTDAISEAPDTALDTLYINAPIAGGAGLTKTGPGFVSLSGDNLYTGGTTISGPGGLTIAKDSALGGSGGVTFNSGGTLRIASDVSTNRAFTIGTTGGRIESFGTLTLNGDVGGSGTLTIGRFTGGTVVMSAANTFSGALVIANDNRLNLTGRLASVGSITLGGTLDLGSGRNDAPVRGGAPINSLGGLITVAAGTSTDGIVSLGALTLASGTTTLNTEPTVGGRAIMTFSQLNRVNRSTAFLRGRDLGQMVAAPNTSIIDIITGGGQVAVPGAIGGGGTATSAAIYPFLFGNKNTVGGNSQISVVEAGLVSRNSFGFAPLDATGYATAIGANALDNVRISDSIITQNSAATMNGLVVRDTLNSNGQSGITGSGTLTVTSGAILAVTDLAGEELFIDNPLTFGAAEGVVHVAESSDGFSQLTLRGTLSGSNGLTKSGPGDLYLENTASTYGGATTIDAGFLGYAGSVGVNAASALGNSNADVVINAGVTAGQYTGLLALDAGSTFARNIVVHQDASANSLAFIGTYGGYGTSFSGQVTIDAGFVNLFGGSADDDSDAMIFSGSVVGAGGLQEIDAAAPLQQIVRLTGANTYSGGTVIRAGRWEVGSNTALGTGTVYFVGNNVDGSTQTGSIEAFGGARSLANAVVLRATPVFSGTNALTLTGPVDLGSVPREVNVTSTADVTLAGVVSRGGLTKTGSGRLVLSGANTFNGQAVVAAGALRISNNAALGQATGLNSPGQSTFITGGTLELANDITTPETIYFGAGDSPISAASATGNLRSVSGNNTISGSLALDNVGTIGVDAGSTLTLLADSVDNTDDNTAALHKVGTGTLAIKNVRLPSLMIDAGTVRVTPAGAPLGTSRVSSLSIAAGAKLDLTNNAFVLDYTAASPLLNVQSLLASGAIVTTATQPGARVAYAEASALFAASSFSQSFAGQSIDNTTVLMLETLGGDTNLDRTVNFADLVVVAQNYNQSSRVWTQGDFNYDGVVNFADLVTLAQSYNGTATGAIVAASLGSDFAADWAMAQSLVPEPASLGALLGVALIARRRR